MTTTTTTASRSKPLEIVLESQKIFRTIKTWGIVIPILIVLVTFLIWIAKPDQEEVAPELAGAWIYRETGDSDFHGKILKKEGEIFNFEFYTPTGTTTVKLKLVNDKERRYSGTWENKGSPGGDMVLVFTPPNYANGWVKNAGTDKKTPFEFQKKR